MAKLANYGALAGAGMAMTNMANNNRQDRAAEMERTAQAERDQRLHEFRMEQVGAQTAAADARSNKEHARQVERDGRVYDRNRADLLEDRDYREKATAAGQDFQIQLSNAEHQRQRGDAKEDRQEERRLGALDQAAQYAREDSQGEIKHRRAMELKMAGKDGMGPMDLAMIQESAAQQAEDEASDRAGWLSSDQADFNMSRNDWVAARTEQIVNEQVRLLQGGGAGVPARGPAAMPAAVQPPPGAIAALKQNRSDPAMVRMFDAKYGAGAAERVLAQ